MYVAVLKRDQGKPGVDAGTNLTSDVGTAITTSNSCMIERKKEKERKNDRKKERKKEGKEHDEENKEIKFRNTANRKLQ